MEGCPVGRSLPRPGQAEQDRIIANYEERLEALKRNLSLQSETLNSQLEKGKEFEKVTSDLSSWLDDLEGGLDDFKIRDPKSDIIKSQQQKCQVMRTSPECGLLAKPNAILKICSGQFALLSDHDVFTYIGLSISKYSGTSLSELSFTKDIKDLWSHFTSVVRKPPLLDIFSTG